MSIYFLLKNTHMALALLSFSGFLLRAWLMFRGSPLLKKTWVQLLPHILDGFFLAAGFTLAFVVGFGLFTHAWLAMKILLLMCYLLFVGIALSRGSTRRVRSVAFVLAVGTFLFIIGIARYKTPMGWLVLL